MLGTDLSSFRIPGVLQRFAISYFVVASSELWLHYPIDDSYSVCYDSEIYCNAGNSFVFHRYGGKTTKEMLDIKN